MSTTITTNDDPLPQEAEQRDEQLVAAFRDDAGVSVARKALIEAGVPDDRIKSVGVAGAVSPPDERFWHWLQNLFAPHDDAVRLGETVGRGRAMIIVYPQTVSERETAVEVLERCDPIDLEERPAPGPIELNHATLSRADALAMTPIGDPKYLRDSSASADPATEATEVRTPSVRIVEERIRGGGREESPAPTRVRRYVAERDPQPRRVELREEEIGAPREPHSA